MKCRVKIKIPNKMFLIKNKLIRSPFETIIESDQQLRILRSKIKFYALLPKDYEVEFLDNTNNKPEVLEYSHIPERTPYTKISSSSEIIKFKTNDNENNINIEPIQKIFNDKEKNNYDVIKELCLDINQNEEQNKNEDSIVYKCETEIKIEELSDKSSSTLDKFLKGEY